MTFPLVGPLLENKNSYSYTNHPLGSNCYRWNSPQVNCAQGKQTQ